MRKSVWIIRVLFLFVTIGLPTVSRADITYNIDLTVGSGSVVGFITTNGDTGVLALSDIVNWDLSLNDGTPLATLLGPASGNNSGFFNTGPGTALTATPMQLLFNFSAGGHEGIILATNDGSAVLCLTAGPAACIAPLDTPPDITINNSLGVGTFSPETGDVVLGTAATATPESGTLMLLLIALGSVGLMTVVRKRNSRGQQMAS